MKLTARLRRDAIMVQSGTCRAIRLLSCLGRVLCCAGHPSPAGTWPIAGLSSGGPLREHSRPLAEGMKARLFSELPYFPISINLIVIQYRTPSSVWWQVLARAEYNGLLFSFAAATLYYSLV